MTDDDGTDSRIEIIQPCSEACVGFRQLANGGWSDYGICTNPDSPFHGAPVRIGHECSSYVPRKDEDGGD